jgi:hypothetical protein
MTMSTTETSAADAKARLAELLAVKDALASDLDDAHVLSEYVSVQEQIDRIEALWPSQR